MSALAILFPTFEDALNYAYDVEGEFPDVEECESEGGGVHEGRDIYLRVYKHSTFQTHPNGQPVALFLDDAARALRPDATYVELDESWNPPPSNQLP